jgi:multiple sugar transport system ATP-binding protein
MIAGLEEISGGTIEIGGKVVNDMQPKERDIAMVFQNYALYPHMKVRDNMAFSMLLAKRPKSEVNERVMKAAGILGLTELLDRYPRQLSGGQRQRVAMGRAIVRDPQVFLFDEPLSNLDAKLRVAMRTELKELHQRLKTTSVYVTHDQIEAMTMADLIVVMRDGLVEQRGGPLELYDRPANLFVAGFIGSPAMNFVAGKVRRGVVEVGDGVTLPMPRGTNGEEGQSVIFGARPEHLSLSNGGGFPATVVVVEPTGADTQVFREVQRRGSDRGVPRAPRFPVGRDDPPRARSRTHASVRCAVRQVVEDVVQTRRRTACRSSRDANSSRRPRERPPRGRWDSVRRTRSLRRSGRRRRAPSCACCAGNASCRATKTSGWRTPRRSPPRRASRCGSTTKAGRTCGPRRRWRPTSAAVPTSSSPPSRMRTSIRTSWWT